MIVYVKHKNRTEMFNRIDFEPCKSHIIMQVFGEIKCYFHIIVFSQNKANVDATNIRGNTPLHEAAKVNNTDIVRQLVSHQSNPLLTNKNGLTALQLTRDSKITQMLTQAVDKYRLNDALESCRPTQSESVTDTSMTGMVNISEFLFDRLMKNTFEVCLI